MTWCVYKNNCVYAGSRWYSWLVLSFSAFIKVACAFSGIWFRLTKTSRRSKQKNSLTDNIFKFQANSLMDEFSAQATGWDTSNWRMGYLVETQKAIAVTVSLPVLNSTHLSNSLQSQWRVQQLQLLKNNCI